MRDSLLGILLCGTLGCQTGWKCACPDPNCAPVSCPPPKVEVQTPPEVEVKAPRQKVVIDIPPPAAPCPPAPVAAPPPPAPCPPPFPPAPQGMVPPMMSYPQPMMAPVSTEIRERSGFGFMFDTIKIPLPILRPIAVPRPSEMTMTMPVAPAGMMPMMPAMMPMMPGAGGMMGQPPQMASGSLNFSANMSTQQLAMLLQQALGGQLNPQQFNMFLQLASQLPPDQLRSLLGGLAAGGQASANPVPGRLPTGPAPAVAAAPTTPPASPPASAPVSSASLEEQLQQAEQRLKELQALRSQQ